MGRTPVKISRVVASNRRKAFEVAAGSRRLLFPYARSAPRPSAADPVTKVYVDPELGCEAFTYVLHSGKEGTVHIDHVLGLNEDPSTFRKLLLYHLTVETQKQLVKSTLSRREVIRRLGSSQVQFYRLIDQTNYRKSLDQFLPLLHILECNVRLVVCRRQTRSA